MTKISNRRKNGNDPADRQRTCRSYGAWACFRLQRTINMALLTELFHVGWFERATTAENSLSHFNGVPP